MFSFELSDWMFFLFFPNDVRFYNNAEEVGVFSETESKLETSIRTQCIETTVSTSIHPPTQNGSK